jgi:hypothetical protein
MVLNAWLHIVFLYEFFYVFVFQNFQSHSLVLHLYYSTCNIFFEIYSMYVSITYKFSNLHHPHMNLNQYQHFDATWITMFIINFEIFNSFDFVKWDLAWYSLETT